MKLTWTAKDEYEGRLLLRKAIVSRANTKELENFFLWVEANIAVNMGVVRQLFSIVWEANDYERAERLYDSFAMGYNPIPSLLAYHRMKLFWLGMLFLLVWRLWP